MNYEQDALLNELSRIFDTRFNRASASGDHANRKHYGGALYGLMQARKILCGDTAGIDHLRKAEFQFQEGK